MITSVTNSSNPLGGNALGRAGQAVVSQGAAVARAEEAVLRAIDPVSGGYARNGIEQSRRQRENVDGSGSDQDLVGESAELITQKTALHANIAVLKRADRTIGTLLDIFA